MTSASVTPGVHAFSLDAGADAYVPKPYDFNKLAAMIEELVASRNAD
jgi:DNA-binding response OmpR family regulator